MNFMNFFHEFPYLLQGAKKGKNWPLGHLKFSIFAYRTGNQNYYY